ncbi:ubiquitin-associated protein 1-like [Trichomycterus rosablanca]|uniref:ubiquitin-associated protein 1-like n=1 Tax=Trichomycterus rosablanca TaxID=2290929 RepID=UPI002F360A6C
MGSLDDVPFKVPLGALDEPLNMMALVTAPEIKIPDCHQILQDTKYEFSLENWVLTGFHAGSTKPVSECVGVLSSCPPYWLLFSSPPERCPAHQCSQGLWENGQRPRSLSLSAVDKFRHQLPRAVHFLNGDAEHEAAGYSEDNECSSGEEHAGFCYRSGERPKRPLLMSHVAQKPRSLIQAQTSSSASLKKLSSPQSQRPSRKKQSSGGSSGKRHSGIHRSPAAHCKLQPRPSSAGPQPSARPAHKPSLQAARPRTSHGGCSSVADSSVELLYALSQEERKLVETITSQGHSIRSVIFALQRTGTRSADQIVNYLLACDRLCALGYDRTQVEDALEMFQYCESKAAEFLHLLAQFCEMGFQQSTIKEVLLLHENHRESALEELMSRFI